MNTYEELFPRGSKVLVLDESYDAFVGAGEVIGYTDSGQWAIVRVSNKVTRLVEPERLFNENCQYAV